MAADASRRPETDARLGEEIAVRDAISFRCSRLSFFLSRLQCMHTRGYRGARAAGEVAGVNNVVAIYSNKNSPKNLQPAWIRIYCKLTSRLVSKRKIGSSSAHAPWHMLILVRSSVIMGFPLVKVEGTRAQTQSGALILVSAPRQGSNLHRHSALAQSGVVMLGEVVVPSRSVQLSEIASC